MQVHRHRVLNEAATHWPAPVPRCTLQEIATGRRSSSSCNQWQHQYNVPPTSDVASHTNARAQSTHHPPSRHNNSGLSAVDALDRHSEYPTATTRAVQQKHQNSETAHNCTGYGRVLQLDLRRDRAKCKTAKLQNWLDTLDVKLWQ